MSLTSPWLEVKARLVAPVEVFEDNQQRLALAQPGQELRQDLEQTALLGFGLECRGGFEVRDAQAEFGQQLDQFTRQYVWLEDGGSRVVGKQRAQHVDQWGIGKACVMLEGVTLQDQEMPTCPVTDFGQQAVGRDARLKGPFPREAQVKRSR